MPNTQHPPDPGPRPSVPPMPNAPTNSSHSAFGKGRDPDYGYQGFHTKDSVRAGSEAAIVEDVPEAIL